MLKVPGLNDFKYPGLGASHYCSLNFTPKNIQRSKHFYCILGLAEVKINYHIVRIVSWSENLVSADSRFLSANRITIKSFLPFLITWNFMFYLKNWHN